MINAVLKHYKINKIALYLHVDTIQNTMVRKLGDCTDRVARRKTLLDWQLAHHKGYSSKSSYSKKSTPQVGSSACLHQTYIITKQCHHRFMMCCYLLIIPVCISGDFRHSLELGTLKFNCILEVFGLCSGEAIAEFWVRATLTSARLPSRLRLEPETTAPDCSLSGCCG